MISVSARFARHATTRPTPRSRRAIVMPATSLTLTLLVSAPSFARSLYCASLPQSALLPHSASVPPHTRSRCRSAQMLWGDWGWNWGSDEGEANMVTYGLRQILQTEEERYKFLAAVEFDADLDAAKVVLAMKCERSIQMPKLYGQTQVEYIAWRSLLDEFIEARFEGEVGDTVLVEAISERLKSIGLFPPKYAVRTPRNAVASALKALKFVELGLGSPQPTGVLRSED